LYSFHCFLVVCFISHCLCSDENCSCCEVPAETLPNFAIMVFFLVIYVSLITLSLRFCYNFQIRVATLYQETNKPIAVMVMGLFFYLHSLLMSISGISFT